MAGNIVAIENPDVGTIFFIGVIEVGDDWFHTFFAVVALLPMIYYPLVNSQLGGDPKVRIMPS